MHAFLNRLSYADFTYWSTKLKTLAQYANTDVTKLNANFEKIFADIPAAESFLTLFDAFDIATISRPELKESLAFRDMTSSSEHYQKFLSQGHLKKIKTADQFSQQLKSAFNLGFELRDYDVIMTPYQSGKNTIRLSPTNVNRLQNNILLDVSYEPRLTYSADTSVETEVTYFGLNKIQRAHRLFEPAEMRKITATLGDGKSVKQQSVALKLANSILLNKFFDPNEFLKICTEFGGTSADPFTLYKAFVSLHPYKDGNGRAARLYYRWLVLNHFPDRSPVLKLLLNDSDLLKSHLDANQILTWNLTRLWIVSAPTEIEMVRRAQIILKKEESHRSELEYYSLDQAELVKSLGPLK